MSEALHRARQAVIDAVKEDISSACEIDTHYLQVSGRLNPLGIASAVIRALEEPTEEMIAAVPQKIGTSKYNIGRRYARLIWEPMIKAIFK